MKTVLLTGASGFLGSHIAEELINHEFKVVALKRSESNMWRCAEFKDLIRWIECDNLSDAEKEILDCKPEVLVHAAWSGVMAYERDNWKEQEKNIKFIIELLGIVKRTKISRVIALGSQAEYGHFEGSLSEDYPCNPVSSYGAAKVCASVILKVFAEQMKIDWYWIRLFSIFGSRENSTWLIPSVIRNLALKKKMDLTSCEQRYDYLYTKDFASGILKVIESNNVSSGIYNFSSGESIKILDIISILESIVSPNQKLLKIGALPYRSGQVMHMQGNSDRFFKAFNFRPSYNISEGLYETIDYYLKNNDNELCK